MPEFEDFLNAFSHNPETFNEEQFKAAIKNAHDADMTTAQAALTAKDEEIKTRDERITKLGADNWNLLMKQGPKVSEQKNPADPSGDDQDPKPKTIDSMFKKVEPK